MDRNTILAVGLMFAILLGWQALVVGPKQQAAAEARRQIAEAELAQAAAGPGAETPGRSLSGAIGEETSARSAEARRIPIETPTLKGTLNLRGATLDDLELKDFRETVDDDSPLVRVLSPRSRKDATFVRSGIIVDGKRDSAAEWTAAAGARLTPETPLTLTRDQGNIRHEMVLAVDDAFMFTVTHKVINGGGDSAALLPYGYAEQRGVPGDLSNFMILFEGLLGVTDGKLSARKYKKLDKSEKNAIEESGTGGWVGVTEKYWLAAAIPPQDQKFDLQIERLQKAKAPTYRSSYQLEGFFLEPGQEATVTSHLFAGAKVVETLRDYETELGITDFDKAVDWGMFFFLTRPIHWGLHFFGVLTGNYGVAILLLTLVIKALLFPLANASYRSMAGMRKVAPEMKRIQERYKDDKMKQQQEVMGLYKKYKINPAAGCLPVLMQMPIFFALYKVLFTTIEIRHEPFLYIPDLSEQDPTTIFNLFGLLPFDPTLAPVIGPFLGLGILPLLMGAAMWVQTKLNPPPADPTQALVFSFLPLIFMFIFAPFAAGLVLYWFWNTFLGVVQQYFIMKGAGADVDLIGNIKSTFSKGSSPSEPTGSKPAND
ncbi:MAG: membrane protein insertase YidC [Pseudomonadota bacterium]